LQYPDHGEVKASQLDATSECSRNVSAACGNKNFASNASQDPMFSKAVEFQQGSAESLAIPQQSQQNMQSAAARSPLFAKPTLGSNKGNNTTPVSPVAGHLTGEHMNNFNGILSIVLFLRMISIAGRVIKSPALLGIST
jgi:hypothetical protein